MKKTSTKLLALLLALAMVFGLTACGENPKKDEAIDAFNKTSTAFNEVANIYILLYLNCCKIKNRGLVLTSPHAKSYLLKTVCSLQKYRLLP